MPAGQQTTKQWSIHTSYPSVARRPLPAEIDAPSSARSRRLGHQLDKTKRRLARVHRTALCTLGHQRKIMETSMLKYSERMKEISDSRTTRLFKQIQERKSNVCGCRTDVQSEPELKHRLSAFWDESERCSEGILNIVANERRINAIDKAGLHPFYGVRSKRVLQTLNDIETGERTASETTHRLSRVVLPKLLLKRSSSADLLKLCSRSKVDIENNSVIESVHTISRKRG